MTPSTSAMSTKPRKRLGPMRRRPRRSDGPGLIRYTAGAKAVWPMNSTFVTRGTSDAIPIWVVTAATWPDIRERLDAATKAFAEGAGFEPKAGRHMLLPGKKGLGGVLFGREGDGDLQDRFLPGRLAQLLPDGVYRFANEPHDAKLAALAVALGSYKFTRYRKSEPNDIKL